MSCIYDPWSDEEIALMETMRSEKKSFRAIAEAVGRSRNACIGRARRMDEQKSGVRKKTIRKTPKVKNKRKKETFFSNPNRKPLKKDRHEPLLPPEPKTDSGREWVKSIVDLERNQCRYPRGEGTPDNPFEFCGLTTEPGCSYCEEHRAICSNGTSALKTDGRRHDGDARA